MFLRAGPPVQRESHHGAAGARPVLAQRARVLRFRCRRHAVRASILVGALNVGSMATVWHGDVTPRKHREVTALPVTDAARRHDAAEGRGDGAIQHGLDGDPAAPAGRRRVEAHAARRTNLRMGERIGTLRAWTHGSRCRCRSVAADRERRGAAPARAGAAHTREFFRARGVLEVETPAMVNAPVSDVNLGSVRRDGTRTARRRCSCTPPRIRDEAPARRRQSATSTRSATCSEAPSAAGSTIPNSPCSSGTGWASRSKT